MDILRVVCALLIYARHSNSMFGCTYGHSWDALFTGLTSPVMTCFFILSGFSIHYQHRAEDITADWIRLFLKKRLISIMPSYLLIAVIWPIVYPAQVKDWVLLLPIDIFGVQTSYRTLFGILHNGGTWFVSCMLLCYACYPIAKSILGTTKRWVACVMVIIPHFLLMYSNVIIPTFSLDGLYSNPIARTAEFMIGVGFAEIVFGKVTDKYRSLLGMGRRGITCTILVLSLISVVIAETLKVGIKTMIFGYLVIPVVLLILYASTLLSSEKLEKCKILSAFSGMSYQFFFGTIVFVEPDCLGITDIKA